MVVQVRMCCASRDRDGRGVTVAFGWMQRGFCCDCGMAVELVFAGLAHMVAAQ